MQKRFDTLVYLVYNNVMKVDKGLTFGTHKKENIIMRRPTNLKPETVAYKAAWRRAKAQGLLETMQHRLAHPETHNYMDIYLQRKISEYTTLIALSDEELAIQVVL